MDSNNLIIGVTGGVGSGKSTFVRLLKNNGADTLDVDVIAKQLTDEREAIRNDIRDKFGESYFNPEGRLRRRELGQLVFSDSQKLKKLNAILWTPMLKQLKHEIESWQSRNTGSILVVDMAVLFEARAESMFDQTILITASEIIRIERLRLSRDWTDQEICDRMRSQLSDTEKWNRADFIIQNDDSVESLEVQAKSLIQKWKQSILN